MLLATLLAASGCSPSGSGPQDDEREPHYVLGKSRVNAMDYRGAVEAFDEALEVNPRSAPAHFQLACLFDTKISDPAAAIYHYREYLRLDPRADNAAVITQRIYSCKQQLAADVMPLPSAPAAQKQLDDLTEKNRELQAQVNHLNDVIKQWSDYYQQQQQQQVAAVAYVPQPNPASQPPDTASSGYVAPAPAPTPAPVPASRARTCTVARGETLAAIARKHGVSLPALLAANPDVSPKKLRVGQVIHLPAR